MLLIILGYQMVSNIILLMKNHLYKWEMWSNIMLLMKDHLYKWEMWYFWEFQKRVEFFKAPINLEVVKGHNGHNCNNPAFQAQNNSKFFF
jgi:hypothetical protein